MRKVVWGVLSTAKIGLLKVITWNAAGRPCEVVAIASRDAAAAAAVSASPRLDGILFLAGGGVA